MIVVIVMAGLVPAIASNWSSQRMAGRDEGGQQ